MSLDGRVGKGRKGIRRLVESKYREAASRLSQNLPAEHVSLYEASRGRLGVRLHSGDEHVMEPSEVESLLEITPPYFWKLAKIPIVLRYEKRASGSARYVVQGDSWTRRLVELMVRGEYGPEGVRELSVSEFKKLIARYKTLFFVTLSP
ncbi:MAG: DUF61 family protein [Aeropyrum sp.]|nr:DUF61 family protein [Aeropyrum sp.]MCE4616299.1 DUF61 family protein [Aeropyrum sp.]